MKEKWITFIARILKILCIINIGFLVLSSCFAVGTLLMIFVGNSPLENITGVDKWAVFGGHLIMVVFFIISGYLLTFLLNIVENMVDGQYFIQDNVGNIRKILKVYGIWILFDILSLTIVYFMMPQEVINNLDQTITNIFTKLSFLAVIYIIYLVFQRGIALQNDHNKFI